MKLTRIAIAAVTILLTAAVSCRKEDEPLPVITMGETLVTYKGGTQTVTVAAQKEWKMEVTSASGTDWLQFTQYSGTGITSLFLTVKPNDGEDVRQAEITVITPSHRIGARLVQGAKTAIAMPGWMELPALNQPELGFYTHSMDGGRYIDNKTSGVRNWSFYYDFEAYVSWWVAYPLNKGLIGSGGRSDSWQSTDPLLLTLQLLVLLVSPGRQTTFQNQ